MAMRLSPSDLLPTADPSNDVEKNGPPGPALRVRVRRLRSGHCCLPCVSRVDTRGARVLFVTTPAELGAGSMRVRRWLSKVWLAQSWIWRSLLVRGGQGSQVQLPAAPAPRGRPRRRPGRLNRTMSRPAVRRDGTAGNHPRRMRRK